MTLDEMLAINADVDREAERLRLVGEMTWARLWAYFVHAHRDLWQVPSGWESHGDHEAFEGALADLHLLRQRLWAVTPAGERGPRPALCWWEQVEHHGGFGDVQ